MNRAVGKRERETEAVRIDLGERRDIVGDLALPAVRQGDVIGFGDAAGEIGHALFLATSFAIACIFIFMKIFYS